MKRQTTTALVAALAVSTLNLPAVAQVAVPPVAPVTALTTNNLPAKPELRAVDAGLLVNLRGTYGYIQSQPGKLNMVPPDLPPQSGIELVAARGGTVSGQAVLWGQSLSGAVAVAPVLTGPGGARLPSTAVQVRWLTGAPGGVFADVFSATPVEKQIQPVLVTVTVPKEAAPGVYTGQLQVTADGFKGAVAVKLEVMSWVLPPPQEWRVRTGLIHSPETIALQYNVAPWSDEHMKLMEPSLRLLRDIGSESCQVFLIAEGAYYNRYSQIRWKGNTLDFTYLDRYLDAWEKVCGKPKTLTVHVWEANRGFAMGGDNTLKVTRIEADGTMKTVPAPYFDQPEAEAFWKPAFDGIRARLAQRGWKDTEVFLGTPWDTHLSEEALALFQKVVPDWRWRVFTHGFNMPMPKADGKLIHANGAEIGWIEGIDAVGENFSSGKQPHMSAMAAMTNRVFTFTAICRTLLQPGSQAWIWRDAPVYCVRNRGNGVSQLGLDYWTLTNIKTPTPGLRGQCLMQWGGGGGFNPRHNANMAITVPGPNGAEPTLCYELLREGIQVSAAYAVARGTPGGKVFSDLMIARCGHSMAHPHATQDKLPDQTAYTHARWNAALRELYKSAAETK